MIALMLSLAVPASGTVPPASDCAGDPAITWRVEGGFATLRPEAAERGDALLDAIAGAGGRMRPGTGGAYDAIVAALVDRDEGREPLYALTLWDRAAERYAVSPSILRPATVSIRARFAGSVGNCSWTVDGATTVQPCGDARLSLARGADGVRGSVRVKAGNGRTAVGCARVDERLIVGLGDSYASGEGNPDHPTRWKAVRAVADAPTVPTPPLGDGRLRDRLGLWDRRSSGPLATAPASADAQWWDNACHRSLLSQQALAAMAHAAADRHRRVVFLSFACSGATVFDGLVGPRKEAPGADRPDRSARVSVALRESQLEQLVGALCEERAEAATLPVPATAEVWSRLRIRGETAKLPRSLLVPGCRRYVWKPDALLLSVGGNDVGFGGVGAWALLPNRGRLPIDVIPLVNKVFGGGARKVGFGIVCPGEMREGRCGLNTARLVRQLPAMFGLLDDALAHAGLSDVPEKVQTSYPLVTHAEDGRVRGCLAGDPGAASYELLNEPWLPAYSAVLDLPVRADRYGRWSFGIQDSEMELIDRVVLSPLNAAIVGHAGWSVLPPSAMPGDHGICAADGELATLLQHGASGARVEELAFRQFGWPRYHDGGWSGERPSPMDWDPYAVRARWVRTATDSALTQSVLDGGLGHRRRSRRDRLGEALTGGLHPALALHAAMAEAVAAHLEDGTRRAPGPASLP